MYDRLRYKLVGFRASKGRPYTYNPDDPLTTDSQRFVATEEALDAAVALVMLYQYIWTNTLENLSKEGIIIQLPEEVDGIYGAMYSRLTAAIKVVGETLGIDVDAIREVLNGE